VTEAGSFADRVKTQADIVRIVGDYVRLKKSGQSFTGLCPFHSEKTPSFNVHPVRQFYYCFGCGVGGDVFSFIQAMERCEFPEAVRIVAEKSGIPVPRQRESSPHERRDTQQRSALIEMHKEAAAYFAHQLETTIEGRAARAYLEDRGLDSAAIPRFALGYALSSGDALLRHLTPKFPDQLLDLSGLFSRDQAGRPFDRFRRRIIFPIADDRGRIVAFGGRALGDDLPKYLNSPETPIYTKSNILYHLDKAKDAIRQLDFAVLVEGYMDTIAVARAGVANVVASCGTSLTEAQIKQLARFAQSRRIVVNFDPDAAGQSATERSLTLLLENNFDARVLALPGGADPDTFIKKSGADAYKKLLAEAPAYLDYLIARARSMDLSTGEGKLRAMNFLMPFVQRVPNRLPRSEWATRIAQQLRIEEPVLREALRRAASERRSEVKAKPELVGSGAKPAERRLLQMLLDSDALREKIAAALVADNFHKGLESEKIFIVLLQCVADGLRPDPTTLGGSLDERDRRLLFEIAFAHAAESSWEEAESCLAVLRRRHVEAELFAIQRQIEANPSAADLRSLLSRKQELRRLLDHL